MTLFYLIRHGTTEQNEQSLFQGKTDNPLSRLGLKQAQLTSKYLLTKNIGKIYSSPLKRSLKTAQPLKNSLNLKIETIQTLSEIDCGDWENQSVDKVRLSSDLFNQWLTKGKVKAPNGESIEDLITRVSSFLNNLIKESQNYNKNIAVFAHGAINRAIICHLLDLPAKKAFRFEQANCCINCFSLRDNFPVTMNLLNYTEHLSEL